MKKLLRPLVKVRRLVLLLFISSCSDTNFVFSCFSKVKVKLQSCSVILSAQHMEVPCRTQVFRLPLTAETITARPKLDRMVPRHGAQQIIQNQAITFRLNYQLNCQFVLLKRKVLAALEYGSKGLLLRYPKTVRNGKRW